MRRAAVVTAASATGTFGIPCGGSNCISTVGTVGLVQAEIKLVAVGDMNTMFGRTSVMSSSFSSFCSSSIASCCVWMAGTAATTGYDYEICADKGSTLATAATNHLVVHLGDMRGTTTTATAVTASITITTCTTAIPSSGTATLPSSGTIAGP